MKVVLILMLCAASSFGAYSYKRTVAIDHTKTGSTDLTDFPVLVKLSGTVFRNAVNGGHLQNANGWDVAFFADVNLTSPLAWEIDSYDELNGTLSAWVRLPRVSHTLDTTFYVGYGDIAVSTFQSTASSVWDASYRGVWHLANGSTLSGTDSTANSNNSSGISATATTGKVSGGAAFNGSAQVLTVPNAPSLNFSGAFTAEAWFLETDNGGYRNIISKGGNFGRSMSFFLAVGSFNSLYYDNVGTLTLSNSWTLNTWNHIVLVDDGTNITVYLNGVNSYSNTGGVGAAGNTSTLNMGYAAADNSYSFQGSLDEVRVSSVSRSSDWVLAEYNNQNNPGGFIAFGAEQSVSQASVTGATSSGQPFIF